MKQYKTLFFDLDHTLWDFDKNARITLDTIYKDFELEHKGIGPIETFKSIYEKHNADLWELLRQGKIDRETLKWKRMMLTLEEFEVADESLAQEMSTQYMAILPFQGQLVDGAIELLDYCQSKGYEMHIITNGFNNTQSKKLDTCNIAHYFTHCITSETSNAMKPNRDIFDYTYRLTGANPESSIIIGDTLLVDVLGGINGGMDQVWFNPEGLPAMDAVQPTYNIQHLLELKEIF